MNPCQNAARCSDFAFFFPPSLPLLSLSPGSSRSLSLSSSLHLPAERQLRQTGVLDKPVLQGEGGSFRSGFGPAAEQKSQNNHPAPLASALQNPVVFLLSSTFFFRPITAIEALPENTQGRRASVCVCAHCTSGTTRCLPLSDLTVQRSLFRATAELHCTEG